MANTLKIKRRASGGAVGAPPLDAGELAINFADNKLYVGDGTVAVPIGGKGEFVDLGSEQTITGKKTFSGGIDMLDNQIENLLDPRNGATGLKDATNRGYVDSAISTAIAALGDVFEYVGNVGSLTDPSDAFNLDTLVKKEAGDYYRVDIAGTYTAAGQTLLAKVGDAFVRTATDWQRIDNVDVQVSGTLSEITVTGDENAGYVVSIAEAYTDRVEALETKTQNISATPGETVLASVVKVQDAVGTNAWTFNRDGSGGNYIPTGAAGPTFSADALGNVSLGSPYLPATNINVASPLMGVNRFGVVPHLENFVIDGGTF
jgi:hypothetical protein